MECGRRAGPRERMAGEKRVVIHSGEIVHITGPVKKDSVAAGQLSVILIFLTFKDCERYISGAKIIHIL